VSWVAALARPDIVALKPYLPADWEPHLVRLHANELPWRVPGDYSRCGLNRYPEPQPRALAAALARLYGVAPAALLLGRGSDEAIDLLVRAFCRAGQDAVLVCPPTFGMYAVAAAIQGARVVEVPLRPTQGFMLDEAALLEQCSPDVKLVFLCSPNNPTGNLLAAAAILRLAAALASRALVIVDEAYVEFAGCESLARELPLHPNLGVLRTLSKAHGLAGARCGALLAHPEVIALLNKLLPPYAISQLTVEAVTRLLSPESLADMRARTGALRDERERLARALIQLPRVRRVWPSQANFILAEFADAGEALARAAAARLRVRDARGYVGLGAALRITIGTAAHNERLLRAWA
jgi:histidinol-phosphate aminotransferase